MWREGDVRTHEDQSSELNYEKASILHNKYLHFNIIGFFDNALNSLMNVNHRLNIIQWNYHIRILLIATCKTIDTCPILTKFNSLLIIWILVINDKSSCRDRIIALFLIIFHVSSAERKTGFLFFFSSSSLSSAIFVSFLLAEKFSLK